MSQDSGSHPDPLRVRAERQIMEHLQANTEISPDEVRRLLHELQVHQIELEMQNEELRGMMTVIESSRQQFHSLFDRAPVGYLVLDGIGLIVQVNDTFCRMVHNLADQILKHSLKDFIVEEDRDIFLGRYRAFFKNPEGKTLEARLQAHGPERFVRMEGSRIEGLFGALLDQQHPHLLLTVSDITERKQYEEALRASEERYHTLFTSIEEGFALCELICDPRGHPVDYRFLDVNPAFERLIGYQRELVLGKTAREIMPSVEPYWLDRYAKATLTYVPLHFEDYFQPTNAYYRIHVYSPSRGRFAVLFSDITERVRSEEALRTALEERKVFYRELQHRSKNSMAMVASMVSLEVLNATHEPVIHALSNIRDRIRTLSELYQLLFLAGDVQKVWLNIYFQQIINILQSGYIKNMVHVALHAYLEEILVDEKPAAALGLILNELLTNALKYAFPDGRPGNIYIQLRQSGDEIIFCVEDDGVGLEENFDMQHSQGLGMQLIIMLTGQLKGEISFTPRNPTGFRLKLPRSAL